MSKINYKDTPDYKRGLEVFKEKYDPSHLKLIEELYEFSPELADVIIAHGLCDIWDRKTSSLSIKEKEIAVLTTLITSCTVHSEIKAHAYNCLNIGMTKQEIKDLLVLMTLYIGVPKTIVAMKLIKEAFEEYDKHHN